MSLYLSRLVLDPGSRQVISELVHPHEMHRTLMRGFPDSAGTASSARADFGVLFRPEVDDRLRRVAVLVQSYTEPDWSSLERLGGYLLGDLSSPGWECKDLTRSLQTIAAGQVLAFRLRANPTKRVGRDEDPLKGKRVELQREQEQLDWLAAKGHGGREGVPGGFELLMTSAEEQNGDEVLVPRVQVRREGKLTGRKKESSGGHILTHSAVVFDGVLRVTDAQALISTVRLGVGAGKAYGFGLLSLAPPSAYRPLEAS